MEIKQQKGIETPAILLTAEDSEEYEAKGLNLGAADYLTKPIKKEVLLTRVKRVLNSKDIPINKTQPLIKSDKSAGNYKTSEGELLEITKQLADYNKMLLHTSYIDSLTGIANRRHFDNIFNQELKRAIRNNKPLSVIMIDIDFFKAFNDNYGHQRGDECLKQVADALRTTLKRPGDFVARYGGEEFVVVLPNAEGDGAMSIAEKLRKCIETLKIEHSNSKNSKYVTASLGVATIYPAQKSTSADLIASADKALYKAKQKGRNCVFVYAM